MKIIRLALCSGPKTQYSVSNAKALRKNDYLYGAMTRRAPHPVPMQKLEDHTASDFLCHSFEETSYEASPYDDATDPPNRTDHRDDYYVFLLVVEGSGTATVDFRTLEIDSGMLLYIRPGQIHRCIRADRISGWSLAVAPCMLEASCRDTLDRHTLDDNRLRLSATEVEELQACFRMLSRRTGRGRDDLQAPLLHVVTGMIAQICGRQRRPDIACAPRYAELALQFRLLLTRRFRSEKRPSAYARELHVSPAYLYEAVKAATGISVGRWIRQEATLEAQRLLCYSRLAVKEIAFTLGYADPAYFSRLFTKCTGMSPAQFRKKCGNRGV